MARRVLAILACTAAAVALGARVSSEGAAAAEPARSGKGGRAAAPSAPAPATMKERATAIDDIRQEMKTKLKAIGKSIMPEIEAAAERVVKLREFQDARIIRVHLNARQFRVRLAALEAGKKLVFVQPDFYNLILVDPAKIRKRDIKKAATPTGMKKFGQILDVNSKIKVDLFVIASVAVNPSSGCRVGPAGSSEELEYGMLRQMRAISKKTPVVTMAESFNVLKGMSLDSESLCAKVPADIVCAPKRTFVVKKSAPKLSSIDFDKLSYPRMATSRLLRRLRDLASGDKPLKPLTQK